MIIEFYTSGAEISAAVLAQLRDEIIELHRRYERISRANISFRQKTKSSNAEKICEISLFMAGNTIVAKGSCKNFDHACQKAMALLNETIADAVKHKLHLL